ncbi:MAG TPA: tRNA (adenosine(37)-N6)-threonylcarbamoyltransferase complex ATPase subunit type 1 TsaE [Phycisphaerales bacterium]|nr:tRNA (adenosine(37)-N6)-threonylcarbamoyltransferase complex ATPase subunit type 1 TsaE [Phycisphaerales bacterium]
MHAEIELRTLDDTAALGRALAGALRAGDALALRGELGAGKTTLVRAIAEARGIDPALVSSPTFVMVNEYPPPAPGEPPIVHVDAYRLRGEDDLDALGWDRLADGSAVLIVEWADRIAHALPPHRTAWVTLAVTGESSRRADIEAPGSWAERAGIPWVGTPDCAPTATVCPITGRSVPADAPTWPFADERARMADFYRWMSGQYAIERKPAEEDEE